MQNVRIPHKRIRALYLPVSGVHDAGKVEGDKGG